MELEIYYEVLQNADQNWYEGENDPKPFIKYMLGITGVFVEYGGSSD